MTNFSSKKRKNLVYIIFLMSVSTIILCACSKSTTEIKKQTKETNKTQTIIPIKPPEGNFTKIGGWLNNHVIVYVTSSVNDASHVYTYDLYTGKSKLMYKSPLAVSAVLISPNQKYVLIQSSQSRNQGELTILDLNGKPLFSQTIASFQLSFQWNPNADGKILVTSFDENWAYQTYLLDIEAKTMDEIQLEQPFAHWYSKNKFVYIDWNMKTPTLSAPVVEFDLDDQVKRPIIQNVYQLNSFQKMFLAISVNETNTDEAVYSFFSNKFRKIISITMPHLSKYSDWLVPYNDMIGQNNTFITFRPISSGEADVYKEGFQLVSYNLSNGKEKVLFNQMKNEPLSCSPDGKMCLYGNQLEKLLILNNQKLVQLIK